MQLAIILCWSCGEKRWIPDRGRWGKVFLVKPLFIFYSRPAFFDRLLLFQVLS